MTYLGREQPGTWSHQSRMLAEGLAIYEANVNEWGIPHRVDRDPDMNGWLEVDDSLISESAAAIDRYRKNTPNPEPGVLLRVINTKPVEPDN
jgi:hypothetical protein